MTGAFTSPTAFRVQVITAGACYETFVLTGEFVSQTSLSARLAVTFTGSACPFTTCTNHVWDMTGTRPVASCCTGSTGNVDCDPGNGTDISDLSRLIDFLYISFDPLCCEPSANLDGQSGTDISDLSALIDYLYISFTPPANCQ